MMLDARSRHGLLFLHLARRVAVTGRSAAAAAGLAFGLAVGDAAATPLAPEREIPRGEVVERVACRADPAQTYALYLPSAYAPGRPWPVLYALDPGARGRVPVERFRDAAETYGYVVAGSNDSRNGPLEPSLRALAAVIEDTRARFDLDERRHYLAGFSGGARVASVVASLKVLPVAGIVACGAGLGQAIEPASIRSVYYLAVVGGRDFNYLEVRDLDRRLRAEGVGHRLILTDEPHTWPPAETCARALGWLELEAMASGLRTRDDALVASVLAAEEESGRALEQRGDLEWAFASYAGMAPLLRGLRPSSGILERLATLQQDGELRRQVKQEDERAREERARLRSFRQALVRIRDGMSSDIYLDRVLDDLGTDRLVRTARKDPGSKDGQLAARLLASLTVEARELGWHSLDAGDGPRAGLFFETAMRASALDAGAENDLRVWLACARSRTGDRKRALKLLREAAAAGFSDREFLEEEPSLASLRAMPEFQEILRSLPEAPSRP
jgi:predicted esterase